MAVSRRTRNCVARTRNWVRGILSPMRKLVVTALVLLASSALAEEATFKPPASGRFTAQEGEVQLIAVSSRSKWILTTSGLGGTTAVRLHDLETFQLRLEVKGWPFRLSPDGSLVAVGNTEGTSVHEIATGKTLRTVPERTYQPIALSRDGKRLAVVHIPGRFNYNPLFTLQDWCLVVRDVATGEKVLDQTLNDGPLEVVGFSPDDEEVVIAQRKPAAPGVRTVERRHLAISLAKGTHRVLEPPGGTGDSWHAFLSPDGRLVAWASRTLLAVTRFSSGEVLWKDPVDALPTVVFDPEGKTLLAQGYVTARDVVLYDVATGEKKKRVELPAAKRAAPLGGHIAIGEGRDVVFVPLKD